MLYAYASPSTSSPEGKLKIFIGKEIPSPQAGLDTIPVDVLIIDLRESQATPVPTTDELDLESDGPKDLVISRDRDEETDKFLPATQASKNETVNLREDPEAGTVSMPDRERALVESKTHVMSTLSITLTVLSIVVALR